MCRITGKKQMQVERFFLNFNAKKARVTVQADKGFQVKKLYRANLLSTSMHFYTFSLIVELHTAYLLLKI